MRYEHRSLLRRHQVVAIVRSRISNYSQISEGKDIANTSAVYMRNIPVPTPPDDLSVKIFRRRICSPSY